MDNELEYLGKRAILFFEYLDKNKIHDIFPEREASRKDLHDTITSGSLRKLRTLNDIIDNLIIGKSSLSIEIKHAIILFFNKELGEDKSFIINKKLKLYQDIKRKGLIKSRNVINDAIKIHQSDILELTQKEKNELNLIIDKSIAARI